MITIKLHLHDMAGVTAINSTICNETFKQALQAAIDGKRYEPGDYLRRLLAHKIGIDYKQWLAEDEIRDPSISAEQVRSIKQRIDSLNQSRTDTIEILDNWIHSLFVDVNPSESMRYATETPAWALDRLSILHLKMHFMHAQTLRKDVSEEHIKKCRERHGLLVLQHDVLSQSIDHLLEDLASGQKVSYTYQQMKMYNDPATNPLLSNKA